jgi:hypothetical protein
MAPAPTLTTSDVAGLRGQLAGQALLPDDAGYDAARLAHNRALVQSPGVVVLAENGDDVAAAVRFAVDRDLRVSVQATGHGIPVPCNGDVLINTVNMDAVEVDAGAKTARIEAGAKAGALAPAAAAQGLTATTGYSGTVGAVGFTLGGGHGWMARTHGLAVDRVRAIDLVTADGEQLRVDRASDPELFSGLLGSRGNLGIATAVELELFDTPEMHGGRLWMDADRAPGAFPAFAAAAAEAPDDVSLNAGYLTLPPLPEVPEPVRGKALFVVDCLVQDGDPARIDGILAPLRDLGGVLMDTVGPKTPPELPLITMDPPDPMPAIGGTVMLDSLPQEAMDEIIRLQGPESGSPLLMVHLRALGGAIARAEPESTVVCERDAPLLAFMVAPLFDPAAREAIVLHIERIAAALKPWSRPTVWPNFAEPALKAEQVYDGPTLERLRALKATWDPANRLAYNTNITPAG